MSGHGITRYVAVLALLPVISCGSDSPVHDSAGFIIKNARVSTCGGFQSAESYARSIGEGEEKLVWTYDINTRNLSIVHSSVLLNCCGFRTISASQEGEIIIIAENDQPHPELGRCYCLCLIDFSLEIKGIQPGVIQLRLELTVDETTQVRWSGTIDLNDEQGEVSEFETSEDINLW